AERPGAPGFLRPKPGSLRRGASDRRGAGRDLARPQRHGQDHDDPLHHGPSAAERRDHRVRRRPGDRMESGGNRPARHRARARRPTRVPHPNRAREPGRHGREPAAPRHALDAGADFSSVSPPCRAPGSVCAHAVRRRAADARGRPGVDDEPAPPHPRRSDRGSGPGDPGRDLVMPRGAEERGAVNPRRRQEPERAEAIGRPPLRAREGPHGVVWRGGRHRARRRQDPPLCRRL
ncbi:MAG: Branched-chain amino acid transport ATP-binding protein LivF, partial [uncultured Microvirga sp.]